MVQAQATQQHVQSADKSTTGESSHFHTSCKFCTIHACVLAVCFDQMGHNGWQQSLKLYDLVLSFAVPFSIYDLYYGKHCRFARNSGPPRNSALSTNTVLYVQLKFCRQLHTLHMRTYTTHSV